jgi:hypothetical protein
MSVSKKRSAASLCVFFTKRNDYQEFAVRNLLELYEVMDMFDKMFPNAGKFTEVDSDTAVYHERWIGERFSIVFCVSKVNNVLCCKMA